MTDNITLTVRRIGDIKGAEDIWRSLLEASVDSTIYQTYEWNTAWWEVFGSNAALMLLVAEDGGEPVGLAPMMVEDMRIRGIRVFRVLSFLGSGPSDYLGFILKKGREPEAVSAFLGYLKGLKNEWDVAWLSEVPKESKTFEALTCSLKKHGFKFQFEQRSVCPYIVLPQSLDKYNETLTQNARKNFTYYTRRLQRDTGAVFRTVTDADEVSGAVQKHFRLHESRWTERNQQEFQRPESFKLFHQLAAERLFENLDLTFLEIDGAPAASIYSYDYRLSRYYYAIGWLPEYAKYSIGNVLIYDRIKDAIDKGFHRFDFLRGDEDYKYKFAVQKQFNERVFFSGSSLKLKALTTLVKSTK